MLLSTCSAASGHPGKPNTVDGAARADIATFCMGRFLIDVPAGSKPISEMYKYGLFQVENVEAQSFEEFENRIASRAATLGAHEHATMPGSMPRPSRPASTTRLFAYGEQNFLASAVKIEGHRWVAGTSVLVGARVSADKQHVAMAIATRHLSLFRPRLDTEIPTEPGYCFAGGFIGDDGWNNEEVGVDIALPDHPDVLLSIDIFPLPSPPHDAPLLNPAGLAPQAAYKPNAAVQVLHHGEREIGPFKGREYLMSSAADSATKAHRFLWQTRGTPQQPVISIELSTGRQDLDGNPQSTGLTDAQALQIWTRIIDSFRLRPTEGTVRDGKPPSRKTEVVAGPFFPAWPLLSTHGFRAPAR